MPKILTNNHLFLSISILTIKNCPSHPPMAPEPRIASIATTALWRKPYRKLLDSITSPAMAPPTVTLSTSGTTGGMNPSGNRKRVRSLKSVLAPTWCFFGGKPPLGPPKNIRISSYIAFFNLEIIVRSTWECTTFSENSVGTTPRQSSKGWKALTW